VASVSPLSKGEELLRKLQETGKERIRELVRNPLRLSLLCQTSYLLPVDEPLPKLRRLFTRDLLAIFMSGNKSNIRQLELNGGN
jgi:predicted NACHT family NTPase